MKKLKNKIIVFTSMLFASFCSFIGLSFSQNNMAVEAKTVTRRNDWIGRAYFDFDDYDTLNIYDINISNKELEEYAYKLTILDNRFVNVKFENCIFENVSVSGSGSCIRIESNEGSGGNISFVNCKFINCSADDGGAIYILQERVIPNLI